MTWQGYVGHEQIVQRFRRSAQQGRLAGTYLFVGPPGVGKREFAIRLAEALLCERNPERQLDPCGECSGCIQARAGTHPDLDLVRRAEDRSVIQVEQLIGDREHRNQEGFCHRISLKPYRGRRRIGIIDDADDLNEEAANCLLKTLEEPPPGAVLILIASSLQRQLPTIRSRAQVVPFLPLTRAQIADVLQQQGLVDQPQQVEQVAALSGGSLQQALEFASAEMLEYRAEILQLLAKGDFDPLPAAKQLTDFVAEAGSDGAAKRRRLRRVLQIAAEFYRALLHARTGLQPAGDERLLVAVRQALQRPWTVRAIGECLERCLDAEQQVAANANQATLVESWFDQLCGQALAHNPLAR